MAPPPCAAEHSVSWPAVSQPAAGRPATIGGARSVVQAEGYVVGSAIKHVPIAGRSITQFVQQVLRDREPSIPPNESLEVAKKIKEQYSYVCPDLAKEFAKYDNEPAKWVKRYDGIESITKKVHGAAWRGVASSSRRTWA